jgi:Zn-dependent M28 family amino/carboxypeptidase
MDWISETFTSSAGWDHLETLVDIGNRMAGSEGERRAAEATRDALADAGARDARLSEFPIQGWTRGSSALETDAESLDCIALPRSPPEDVTADLAHVGHGLPEDFEDADVEGKVVVARSDVPDYHDRYIHRTEKYYYAVEGNAAAFVYANHVPGCLPPTGSVGNEADPIGAIPAIGVSREVGARLARRYDGEEVTVSVDADVHDATSQNVHAELGPDTDEEVFVTSHVDAHDISEGALDNGAGTAMVIELANALARREDELDTKVHCITYGAEEVGLDGSEHHAEATDTDRIRAIVNNDGVCRGRTVKLITNGFDALAEAGHTVSERFDHPVSVTPKCGPHSDHWPYVVEGVPGTHVMSETGDSGRGWGHTHADTLDKLDPRNLRESAILLTEYVVAVADEDFACPHVDPAEIGRRLEDQNLAEGMKVTGEWPFES